MRGVLAERDEAAADRFPPGREPGAGCRRSPQQHIPAARVCVRVDNFNSLAAMLRTGIGVGVLPTFAETDEPDLMPVSAEIDDLATPVWILSHPDLRRTARIVAFMQDIGGGVAQRLAAETPGVSRPRQEAPAVPGTPAPAPAGRGPRTTPLR